jgi:hypothetical protein
MEAVSFEIDFSEHSSVSGKICLLAPCRFLVARGSNIEMSYRRAWPLVESLSNLSRSLGAGGEAAQRGGGMPVTGLGDA